MSFQDSMERKADSELKKVFTMDGAACRPAVALTSIANEIKVWFSSLESAMGYRLKEESSSNLQALKLSAEYIVEAAVDLVRFTSRLMAHSVTARRALWLKHWSADLASKQALCSIPFSGNTLFGKTLEEEICRVTGGKSGLLPQDWKRRLQSFVPTPFQDQSKDVLTYRPGREFSHFAWRSHGSFADQSKAKGSQASKTTPKSF